MAEYIDRKAAIDGLLNGVEPFGIMDKNGNLTGAGVRDTDVIEMLEGLPSSDVQPVRHGHWIEPSRYGFWRYVESAYRECDQCHTPVYLAKRMKFCPECGARMDGEQ